MRLLRIAILLSLCAAPTAGAAIESFHLESGDVVTGEVVARDDAHVVIEHPVFGRLEIPIAKIAPPKATAKEEKKPDHGVFGTGWLAGWKRRIGLGFSGAEGNTVEASVDANVRLAYEDEHRRWKIDLDYAFSSSEGATDKSQGRADVSRDWLLPESPWLFFARGVYEYDRFQDWHHRISSFGGVGYDFYKDETWLLRGRLGAGGVSELDGNTDLRPETVVGIDAGWTLGDWQSVELHAALFPNMIDFGELRSRESIEWNVKIAPDRPIGLSFGADHEYQSMNQDDANDFTYRGLVTYDF